MKKSDIIVKNLDFFSAPYGSNNAYSPDERSVKEEQINNNKYIVIDSTSVLSGNSETEDRQ